MNGINPIAASLYNLGEVKRRKQFEKQFGLINPIITRPGDRQQKIMQALMAIQNSRQQKRKGFGAVFNAVNPFSAAQSGGSQLEQALLMEALKPERQTEYKPPSAGEQISGLKLQEILRIMATPAEKRTPEDAQRINSLLYGVRPEKEEKTKETPLIEQMKFVASVHKAVKAGDMTPETGRAMITSAMNKPYNVLNFPKQEQSEQSLPQVLQELSGQPQSELPPDVELSGVTVSGKGAMSKQYKKKTGYPAEYQTDLQNAISAIDRGADATKVFQRISAKYPKYSTELKRILLSSTTSEEIEALREVLKQ